MVRVLRNCDGYTIQDGIIRKVSWLGGDHSDWYVGITNDYNRRLFYEHKVRESDAYFIYEAIDESVARESEAILVDEHDFDGDKGGGKDNLKFVYAYRKMPHTEE